MKKHLGAAFSASAALMTVAAGLLTGGVAHAQKDYFGGELTGEEFAKESGLGTGDLPETIASIIQAALGFLGIIAVVIILYGGFKWMTAGGNDEKVGDAKKIIIQGIIGLVIVLSAYAIASFVVGQITTAVGA